MAEGDALAIAVRLDGTPPSRPLSPDLLNSTITALGGKVSRIVVSDYSNSIFYAKILVAIDGSTPVEVDSRPSDAIGLALSAGVPIYAETAVLEKMGFRYSGE
jgi:bifunctional DNase/RNase